MPPASQLQQAEGAAFGAGSLLYRSPGNTGLVSFVAFGRAKYWSWKTYGAVAVRSFAAGCCLPLLLGWFFFFPLCLPSYWRPQEVEKTRLWGSARSQIPSSANLQPRAAIRWLRARRRWEGWPLRELCSCAEQPVWNHLAGHFAESLVCPEWPGSSVCPWTQRAELCAAAA